MALPAALVAGLAQDVPDKTLSGAFVAAVGPDAALQAVPTRLERLRINSGQRSVFESAGAVGIGALEHPVLPSSGPFEPFAGADGRWLALLHGRIDNLAEISGDKSTGAAQWALQQWLQGGAAALGTMMGPFVVLIADLQRQQLLLVRDPLGDRSVFYAAEAGAWWVASEELALWPEDGSALTLNPRRLAEFFALEYPSPGGTFFANIRELPPAHWVALGGDEHPCPQRYWDFRYRPEIRAMGPEEAAAGLAGLLEQAVQCQADGDCPTALAVSGGMDSSAIAALTPVAAAARLYTYQTPDFPQCDEGAFVAALAAATDRPLQPVVCDRHWPLSEHFFEPPWLLHEPGTDAYRAMRFELARAAVDDGCRIMLTGDFGDQIYSGCHYWLKDLFSGGQWSSACRHLGQRLLQHGIPGLRSDPALRRIMPLVGVTRGRPRARNWLDHSANALLPAGSSEHAFLGHIAEVDRIEGCINSFNARNAHLGYLQGLRWGLEVRTPFRDRRLLEFALSLPAHYLFDPDDQVTKAVMRRAMRGRLPESILQRVGKTSFEPLFRHGVFAQHRHCVEELLGENPHWGRFVRPEWLSEQMMKNRWSDLTLSVLWNCVAFCLWCRQLGRAVKY